MRQGREHSPAISGDVVGVKRVYLPDTVEAARHVNGSIPYGGSHVRQRHRQRCASSPSVASNVVNPGGIAYAATAIKAANVIDLAVEDHRLREKVLVRGGSQGRPGIGCEIETQQIVVDLVS